MERSELTKTHWKKLHNPNFLGQWSIPEDQDLVLTIKSIESETHKFQGGREEEVVVVHWTEKGSDVKPFILNPTNSRIITKIYNTPYIEEWKGKKIALYVDETVKMKGEVVGGVRVRPVAPKMEKEELTPDHKQWAAAMKAVTEGNTTVDKIKKFYQLSKKNEKILSDAKVA